MPPINQLQLKKFRKHPRVRERERKHEDKKWREFLFPNVSDISKSIDSDKKNKKNKKNEKFES